MLDLQPIIDDLITFREERDWSQFHNPKDLAMSISIEAAELLEAFQWSGSDTSPTGREDKIREELVVNRTKYPVNASRGKARKYTEL